MYDIVALGELLIDFCQDGVTKQNSMLFEANPGGAPCNVLSMANKLGKKTAFIGKIGDDVFGHMLKKTVIDLGIDTTGLLVDGSVPTTLAVVSTDAKGDRSFTFYRDPGADVMLTKEEVNVEVIRNSRLFHFGTLSMTHKGVEEATKYAVSVAKEAGLLISFDPNLRKPLWKDLNIAKEKMMYGCSQCDILKIEDEELKFLTGKSVKEAIADIKEQYQIPLILLTAGSKGCTAYYKEFEVHMNAFLQDNTIDTTGAGDTFFGSFLGNVLDKDINALTKSDLEELISFSSAAASIITTKKGALSVMPNRQDVDKLLKERKK